MYKLLNTPQKAGCYLVLFAVLTGTSSTPVWGQDREKVQAILSVLDRHEAPISEKMDVWADDLVHLAPGQEAITSKAALQAYLEEQATYGRSEMTHEIIDLHSYDEIVLMRGQVNGTFYPTGAGRPAQFRTKNLFVFKRQADGSLKIWQVIYNHAPFISPRQ